MGEKTAKDGSLYTTLSQKVIHWTQHMNKQSLAVRQI